MDQIYIRKCYIPYVTLYKLAHLAHSRVFVNCTLYTVQHDCVHILFHISAAHHKWKPQAHNENAFIQNRDFINFIGKWSCWYRFLYTLHITHAYDIIRCYWRRNFCSDSNQLTQSEVCFSCTLFSIGVWVVYVCIIILCFGSLAWPWFQFSAFLAQHFIHSLTTKQFIPFRNALRSDNNRNISVNRTPLSLLDIA